MLTQRRDCEGGRDFLPACSIGAANQEDSGFSERVSAFFQPGLCSSGSEVMNKVPAHQACRGRCFSAPIPFPYPQDFRKFLVGIPIPTEYLQNPYKNPHSVQIILNALPACCKIAKNLHLKVHCSFGIS